MFHVFVEGAADESPDATARLAEAIANHYGLPADQLKQRLDAGRFRVKGNVDRATADSYVRDLARLGARCSLEEAETSTSRATPLPFPAVRPATPPAGLPLARGPLGDQPPSRPSAPPSALANQPPSRPSAPPSALANMPRAPTPPPVQGAYASGLSAAFGGETARAELGALERADATFSLSSVDGETSDDTAIEKSPEPMFAPPPPSSTTKAAPAEKKARPKDEPVDMFAPPDAEDAAALVEIADDDKDFARKRVSTPSMNVPVVRASSPVIATAPITTVKSRLGPLADERVRMIAGALFAVLLGFLPAHFYARSREKAAYAAIDQKLQSAQIAADTPDAWAMLDKTRSNALERKEDERRNIAMIALAIWALVGGGIAYGWFRRVPWDDLA